MRLAAALAALALMGRSFVTAETTSSSLASCNKPPTCEWLPFGSTSYICANMGTVHRTAYTATLPGFPQGNFEECAALCLKLPSCKSSTHDGLKCMFANELPSDAFWDGSGNDLFWSENACFDCQCPDTPSVTTTTTTPTPSADCALSTCSLGDDMFGPGCFFGGARHATAYTTTTSLYPQQDSFEICAAICLKLPGCKSSAWGGGNECLFANEVPNPSFEQYVGSDNSDIFWSANECFICNCPKVDPVTTTITTTTSSTQTTSTSQALCTDDCQFRENTEGLKCWSFGTYHATSYRASRSQFPHQDTFEECNSICLQLPGCKSSVSAGSDGCLFANELPSSAFEDAVGPNNSDLFWSETACFECQCPAVQSVTTTTTASTTPSATPSSTSSSTPGTCNVPTCEFLQGAENPVMENCFYMGTKHVTSYTAPYDLYPHQSTSEECAAICSKLPDCKSSVWAYNNVCYFANQLPSSAFWDVPNNDYTGLSDLFWSDTRCFKCQCPGTPSSTTTTTTTTTTTPTPQPTACVRSCGFKQGYVNDGIHSCLAMGSDAYSKAYQVSKSLYPRQSSFEECGALCSELPGCKTSTVNGYGCLLANEDFNQEFEVWKSGSSDMFWSENACFDCQCPDSQSAGPTTTTTTTATPLSTPDPNCQNTGCRRDYDADNNYLCHSLGIFTTSYEAALDTLPLQGNEEQCAAVCAQIPDCVFSGYSPTLGHCKFSNDETHYAHYYPDPKSQGGFFWSQKQCFQCDACASLPPLPATPPSHCKTIGCTLKPSSETVGKTCHYNGLYGIAYGGLGNRRASNAVDCAGMCAQYRDCKASAWQPEYEECVFSNDALGVGDWWRFPDEAPQAALDYYAQECYDCGPCPVEPTPSDPATPIETTSTPPATPVETTSTPVTPTVTPVTPVNPVTPSSTPTETPGTGGVCNVAPNYGDFIACGINGRAGNQVQTFSLQNYVIKLVSSLWDCAQICLERADCNGFDFNKLTGLCKPYTTGVLNLGLSYWPNELTRFYDKNCFKCA